MTFNFEGILEPQPEGCKQKEEEKKAELNPFSASGTTKQLEISARFFVTVYPDGKCYPDKNKSWWTIGGIKEYAKKGARRPPKQTSMETSEEAKVQDAF